MSTLISDKTDFKKKKNVAKDKEGHYKVIKGSIHQEDITIVSIYDLKTEPHGMQSKN